MPHNPRHDSDFCDYSRTRTKALKHIKELRCYLSQLEAVVKATPATNEEAGYLDLDNCEQWECDLQQAVELLVDFETVHQSLREIETQGK